MLRNNLLIAAALLVAPLTASAGNTAQELKDINERIAIESARLAEIELRLKIAKQQVELDRLGTPVQSLPSVDEVPTVRGIEGMGGKLKATLALRGGVTQVVGTGEKFGEWTVTKIDAAAVTLTRGKESIRLSFGNEPPAISGPGISAPNLPLGIR